MGTQMKPFLVVLGVAVWASVGLAGNTGRDAAPAAPASSANSVAAAPKSVFAELDGMKEEFAALMKKRAGLEEQCRASIERVVAARNLRGADQGAGASTAARYREAAAKVESAIDEHHQVKALKDQYEAVQKEKVAVSVRQGEAGEALRKIREDRDARFRSLIEAAKDKAQAAKKEIMDRSGLKGRPDPSNPKTLSEADEKRLEAISEQLKGEISAIVKAQQGGQSNEQEEKAKADAEKRFEEEYKSYKDLEAKQVGIKKQITQLRGELRKTDSKIAALHKEAAEASHAHMMAVDSSPEASAAHKFLEGADEMRADIDKRARILRKAILEKDGQYKATLDSQAASGGLAQVDESFWQSEG